jgi:iron complex outermembrane receptor protein
LKSAGRLSRIGLVSVALAASPLAARAQELDSLRGMSIEDLAEINVSSVSKTDMPLADAAASIYVINREDIVRSGATTLPEILRLAPNLQVYQQTPSSWVVTARGLNGNKDAQSYSNKLLVLVDGRTVYTPLFSGVYWDLPDVLPDDIDRIEVISGPGATLWGANAVNGVINIITRNASETKGLYVDARAGPDRQAIGARLSGRAGENLSYAIHGRYLHEDGFDLASGASAKDPWRHLQGGFRLDWTPGDADLVTLQGDIFGGRDGLPGTSEEDISGRNLTARWNRDMGGSGQLQAQVFYDRIARDSRSTGGGKFRTDTFDGELQHNITFGAHTIVWGAGARVVDYRIAGTPSFFFDPPHRNLFIADGFAQDSVALSKSVTFVAGLKAEHLPYAGTSLLPEVRLAWKASPKALIWASAERAVRSPTPFDEDVQERLPPLVSLSGNPQFRTEKLTAFELGARVQPAKTFSLSATAFYHHYRDLRNVEFGSGPFALNLTWGNNLKGDIYGVEAWADWQATRWWKLSLGGTWLEEDLHNTPGASAILPATQDGNDPPYVLTLRSSMNPLPHVTLDLDARAVGRLRNGSVKAYRELDGRIAWQVAPAVALSLSGTSLLHDRHLEYPGPGADYIPRRIMGGVELRY